jgi:hypothetical protein
MPAVKRMYKVDTREVVEVLAMATITGDEESQKAIRLFCATFSIPIDEKSLKDKVAQYEVIATALKEAGK